MNTPRWIRAAGIALTLATACGGNVNVVNKQKLALQPVNLPLRTFSFPSGLRVVVEKDTRTPLAGVFAVVGSGASSDPKGKEGLAHYVEHLAFQSKPFGQQRFEEMLDAAGAVTWNASTDFDATTYYEIGPASALPQLLRVEAVRMVVPVSNVAASAQKVELDVVRNELRERNETGFVGDVFSRLQVALFPPGHPNANPIGGTHQSLSSLTQADVEAFAKAHYRPDNVTLVVLGNVDLDKAGELLAETLPEALVAAPQPVKLAVRLPPVAPPVPEPPPRPDRIPKVEAAIPSPELWIGWSMPRGFDRDGYLLTFLASAARQRFARVRIDDKDITSINVFPVRGKDASVLLCHIALQDASHPDQTLQSVLEEADHVVNLYMRDPNDEARSSISGSRYTFSDLAYARSRRTILIAEILGMEDLIQRGLRRATVTHFAEDPTLLSRALRDLADLNPDQFRQYARPYLTADRARAILFVPNGASSRVAESTGRAASPETERKWEKIPPPPDEWMAELLTDPGQLVTRQLENGLSVVLVRRPGLPLVTATVSLGVSPAAAKDVGARALAQAMAFPASRRNPAYEYGGVRFYRETRDSMTYVVEGPSGNAEAVLATLAEEVRSMHLDPGSALHYKESVLPAYQRWERDPRHLADRAFLSAVLPGSPYGHVSEYRELEAASQSDAADWIDRTFVPGNATLVVVGDFDPGLVEGFVEDSFRGWSGGGPRAAAPGARAPTPDRQARPVVMPRPGASQGEVRFGCQLPDVNGDDAVAVLHDVAAAIAADRLQHLLRASLGASYGVHVRAVKLADGTAYLDIQTDVENGKLAPALRELRGAIDGLAAAPVDARTLKWARYTKASEIAAGQMSNAEVASSIQRRKRLGLPPDLGQVKRDLDAVTARDVQSDFAACLARNPALAIVGEEPVVQAALKTAWK